MFSILWSPNSFATDMFMDSTLYTQQPKRRRVPSGTTKTPSDVTTSRYRPVTLRCEVEEGDRGYILSIYKALPRHRLRNEINDDLSIMKDQLYRPVYHYSKLSGRLIEEETDENFLTRQAMSKLDVNAIRRRVAREAFKDYKIELSHRGDGLSIVSNTDAVLKEFDLGVIVDDLEILGCQLDQSCTQAVWRILLIEADKMSLLCGQISVQGSTMRDRNFQKENAIQKGEELGAEHSMQEPETSLDSELNWEPELRLKAPEEDSERSERELQDGLGMDGCPPLKINIDFCHGGESGMHQRYFPMLEEVEDEEINRFKQLVRHAPTGSCLLEEC